MKLRYVVFDAYGTLFDVHSVATLAEQTFPGKGSQLSQAWRQKQLEYTWQRSLMGRYEDFANVTRDALDYACRALDLEYTPANTSQLLDAYRRLESYPEARAALESLLPRRLAVLSNGCQSMLVPLVRNAGFENFFDHVLSVDPMKVYKPHPKVYQLACDAFAAQPGEIGFVSANFWDIAGAAHFGFQTFWINRGSAPADALGAKPRAVVAQLTELAKYV